MNQRQVQGEEEPIMLTVPQAARLLQVSSNHVYGLIAQDAIPHLRFGKLIRIPRWGLIQFIASNSGGPLPIDANLAMTPTPSVHGQQPKDGED